MNLILSQISGDLILDLTAKIGWPGIVLVLVNQRIDRIEHTMKGLSMALWMDLASRPHADPFIHKTAQKEIARLEAQEKKG